MTGLKHVFWLWILLTTLVASSICRAGAATIHSEEIAYEVDGVKLTGFLAYDTAIEGKRPGVLVVHEWWGHNPYVRKRALMLAEMGYSALALDMYGDGKLATHPEDAQKFMVEATSNMSTAKKRFQAARDLLAANPATDADRIAAIGYCFGGKIVLEMARAGMDLAGVASFHGILATDRPAQPGDIKASILVLHGAADPFVPPEQVSAFKDEMAAAGVDLKFVAYPGAKHAFTNPEATAMGEKFSLPLVYDEAADKASWAELDAFLKHIFAN